jgi:hypothetical protein
MAGISCPHAISAILYHSFKPEQYLHRYYSVESYKKAYDPMIYPVPSDDQWVRTSQNEVDPPSHLLLNLHQAGRRRLGEGVRTSQEIHTA